MASKPGAGRGLEHEVGACDRGGARSPTKPSAIGVENCWSAWLSSDRRVCDGSSAAILASIGEQRGGRAGAGAHGGTELAQEQDLRRLAGVVGGLPIPGALGVRTAEGRRHGSAKRLRVDGAAALEIGEQQLRGNQERCGCVGQRRWRPQARAWPRRRKWSSWETSRRAGTGEPPGALSAPCGSNPSRPSSPSHRSKQKGPPRRALESRHSLPCEFTGTLGESGRRARPPWPVSRIGECGGAVEPPRPRRDHSAATGCGCGSSGSDAVRSSASSSSPSARNAGSASPSAAPMPSTSASLSRTCAAAPAASPCRRAAARPPWPCRPS